MTGQNVTPIHNDQEDDTRRFRLPPSNLEAEMGVLGAILVNNQVYNRISEQLNAHHFANAIHGRIYETICKMMDRGQLVTAVTLKDYFEHDGSLVAIGGAQYLVQLTAAAAAIVNAKQYADILCDLATRRALIDIGEEIVNEAHQPSVDRSANTVLEDAERSLFNLAETGGSERQGMTLGQATILAMETAEAAYKRDSHITGVTTGLRDLDYKLGGLHPSDLIILAGRPSMGKTALSTNMAYNAAAARLKASDEGAPVAFFSLACQSDSGGSYINLV